MENRNVKAVESYLNGLKQKDLSKAPQLLFAYVELEFSELIDRFLLSHFLINQTFTGA